jgi:hypothetical protein
MLLYAILAASSRHRSLRSNDWQEASDYLGKCLKLVIQALSHPEDSHSDNLLLTIVCLRLYELFGHESFSALHLDGLACLSSAMPKFLASGGVAEAAAWIALRHDLFIAMMSKQVPKFPLNDFDHSSVFQRHTGPGATAYKIILIWAKILRHLYSTDLGGVSTTWLGLEDAVKEWYDGKGFQPPFQQDANVDPEQPFPIISMINAPQGTHPLGNLELNGNIDCLKSHRSRILPHLPSIPQLVQTTRPATSYLQYCTGRATPNCNQLDMFHPRSRPIKCLGGRCKLPCFTYSYRM